MTDLCVAVRPRIAALKAHAEREWGWQIVVVGTGRNAEQQAEYVRIGTSKAKRSLHQAQPACNLSHAADIVPAHLAQLKNWAPEHPDWLKLGEAGENLFRLSWGGRWSGKWHIKGTPDYKIVDCPHFYIKLDHMQEALDKA